MISSRPQHGQGEHTPDFHVVVTPAKGIFTRAAIVDEGADDHAAARCSARCARTATSTRSWRPAAGFWPNGCATTGTSWRPACRSLGSTTDRSSQDSC